MSLATDAGPTQIFASSRISQEDSATAFTTVLQTIESPVTQATTTFITTTTSTIVVTDPASYSSLLSAESATAKSTTTTTNSLSTSSPTSTSTPTPSSPHSLALILGLVLGILVCFIVILLVIIYLLKRKRKRVAALQSQEPLSLNPATAAEITTPDQINQAVEARFAAEKANRMVQVSAQPIDTISIDSREHGRATVIETIPDQQANQVHNRTRGASVDERDARSGFGPLDLH